MNERIEAIVSGKVQMVFYRDFATKAATALGIVGETKNLPDGTVHVIAEGPREKLEAYVEELRKGSERSNVENVAVTWLPAAGEHDSFSITH